MKKTIIISIMAFLLVVGAVGAITLSIDELKELLGNEQNKEILDSNLGYGGVGSFYTGQTITTSNTLTGGVGELLLPLRSHRKYAIITNTSATIAYLSFTAATSTADVAVLIMASSTIPLAASGGTYEIKSDNLYLGAIQATSSGAVTLRALEAY